MKTYFLNIRNQVTINDPEGFQAHGLSEAHRELHASGRELLAEGIRLGQDRTDWYLELRDSNGVMIERVQLGCYVTGKPV